MEEVRFLTRSNFREWREDLERLMIRECRIRLHRFSRDHPKWEMVRDVLNAKIPVELRKLVDSFQADQRFEYLLENINNKFHEDGRTFFVRLYENATVGLLNVGTRVINFVHWIYKGLIDYYQVLISFGRRMLRPSWVVGPMTA